MNDTTVAFRAKEQLGKFLGKVFTHFSRPKQKFMADMLYGIQASGDTQLSSIMRAINDDAERRHAVEKRLSRNLADDALGKSINEAILSEGVRHVKDDTLLLVDPTEIRKEYGHRMEYISRVRDASRSSREERPVLVNGYHGCMVAACQPGKRKTVPLALELWSSRAPGHTSENDEVLRIITLVMAATGGKGTLVYDRGATGPRFTGPLSKAAGISSSASGREASSRGMAFTRFTAWPVSARCAIITTSHSTRTAGNATSRSPSGQCPCGCQCTRKRNFTWLS